MQVHAVSVNPIDARTRGRVKPPPGEAKILGYDASGVVVAIGPDVTLFRVGDEVWYAGSIVGPGTNAEFHLVGERIVGKKPRSLSFVEAAAMPLTTITAWELLFDRFAIARRGSDGGSDQPPRSAPRRSAEASAKAERTRPTLLIIGAGGGVGSVLTQLARKLTTLTVIGTASRPETREWVLSLGAHHVIDHSQPLSVELARIGIPQVTHVASLTQTDRHFGEIAKSLAPQGMMGLIDEPRPLDVNLLKQKCLSLRWEAMFARSMFQTPDMIVQHQLLDAVADLMDGGTIRTTLTEHFGRIDAANLKRAHAFIERGKARGKIALEGF